MRPYHVAQGFIQLDPENLQQMPYNPSGQPVSLLDYSHRRKASSYFLSKLLVSFFTHCILSSYHTTRRAWLHLVDNLLIGTVRLPVGIPQVRGIGEVLPHSLACSWSSDKPFSFLMETQQKISINPFFCPLRYLTCVSWRISALLTCLRWQTAESSGLQARVRDYIMNHSKRWEVGKTEWGENSLGKAWGKSKGQKSKEPCHCQRIDLPGTWKEVTIEHVLLRYIDLVQRVSTFWPGPCCMRPLLMVCQWWQSKPSAQPGHGRLASADKAAVSTRWWEALTLQQQSSLSSPWEEHEWKFFATGEKGSSESTKHETSTTTSPIPHCSPALVPSLWYPTSLEWENPDNPHWILHMLCCWRPS